MEELFSNDATQPQEEPQEQIPAIPDEPVAEEDGHEAPNPWKRVRDFAVIAGLYFCVELLAFLLLKPGQGYPLLFGFVWAVMLAGFTLSLPRLGGRIFFGIFYFFGLIWGIAQAGYFAVFRKLMWLSTIRYAGEGATFLGDVISSFPLLWWVGSILLITAGVFMIVKFPRYRFRWTRPVIHSSISAVMIAVLCFLPELVFLRDNYIWGTKSEFGQSSSYRAAYNTMYDAKRVYNICGVYHMTMRDIWRNSIYPMTDEYREEQRKNLVEVDAYFDARPEKQDNEMTGMFQGKNVVLVLMESMDDWMITPEDTPTLHRLMDEGIHFTNFYTPGFGSARTLNSEFCMNTGIYLPTTGGYVFDYVTNSFKQSIAWQMRSNGYTSEVFHYNDPDFYSRGVFEPAMGYGKYNTYEEYVQEGQSLFDDCLLFDMPETSQLFFREGRTFNTIITRSAHLSYVYNEVLSNYALKQYPEYRGRYGSEEEDCARVKAKLVDDMFARLLQELESRGELENTVIIGMTDHYTYGYKNMDELYELSDVNEVLLLEKTPCFVWSPDGPDMEVDKTLNTTDLLPTMLNLLGIDSPYDYLGQDAFDPRYVGYALFPDGSWISEGVVCQYTDEEEMEILVNASGKELTDDYLAQMADLAQMHIHISNLLLTTDYYNAVR